jgi:CHAP domain
MQDLYAFMRTWQDERCYCLPDCSGGGPGQCVALANKWCCVNNWERPTGAYAAVLQFPLPWTRVSRAEARQGDLVVWASSLPGSEGYGHIAILVSPSSSTFESFDQNWPSSSLRPSSDGVYPCEQVAHSWDYVQAIWRYPQPQPPDPTPTPEEAEEMLLIAAPNNQGIWLLSGNLFVQIGNPQTQTNLTNAGVKKAAVDELTFDALKAAANK